MDQRMSTPTQLKWLPKLLGFDYEIVYKKGCENAAADALSRLPNTVKNSEWSTQQLLRKGKLVIGEDLKLRQELFKCFLKGSQELVPPPGLLQPLPIPEKVWTHISMDFVDGLPMSKCKSVLLVVVDRLSKYGHFIPLTHPYTALTVAQAFLDNVYKLHDLLKVLYGQPPPAYVAYTAGDSANESVDRSLVTREAAVQLLKFHLTRAQDRMKTMADKKRTKRVFNINDLVLLKLQPYRKSTLRQHKHPKLAPKYYGPFKIVARIREVAYKLDLPLNSQIHPVFHVSQFKKFKGHVTQVTATLPQCDLSGVIAMERAAVLDRRLAKRGNAAAVYVLIQWTNEVVKDATWELYDDIAMRFLNFDLTA
ncbi:retrotransposable element Tf2 [Tanacetum coccineum]